MDTQSEIEFNERHNRSVYLAGAFFSTPQKLLLDKVEELCERLEVQCNSPRKFFILPPKASWADRAQVFEKNCDWIRKSGIVLACLDNLNEEGSQQMLDSGTCWEMGFAYAIKKPVVGFSLAQRRMNVMLAQGCSGFLQGHDELEKFLDGVEQKYAHVEQDGKWWDWNWEVSKTWRQEIF